MENITRDMDKVKFTISHPELGMRTLTTLTSINQTQPNDTIQFSDPDIYGNYVIYKYPDKQKQFELEISMSSSDERYLRACESSKMPFTITYNDSTNPLEIVKGSGDNAYAIKKPDRSNARDSKTCTYTITCLNYNE
jgi:hypothetical protein